MLAALGPTWNGAAKKGRAGIFRAGGGKRLTENKETAKPYAADYTHARFLVKEVTVRFLFESEQCSG